MTEEFVLRQVDISRDAGKLAEMWVASDDQWPGTWSGGTEITPQMVTEWHERQKMIDVYVFESGDKIVAYCSFNQPEEDEDAGYVALLNVQPEYQGRSLGRRLLQRCLERCTELGFHLLTLGTWSGNLKSVPLYKKTGFFWMPDTSAWMFNYVPGILNLPCARPYFSGHDWYKTFRRELKQAEDEERWAGMKVFAYHWEEDGHALTAWADREARRLTAVETDSFFAGAIADNIEPAKGMSTTMRWRIANKQDRPMPVSLIASGTDHIKIDHRATLTVAPGETAEIEASVRVAPDAPDVPHDKPVPAIRTLLIIDGEVLELGTGLRPRPAVAVETSPRYITLFPGVPKTVHLQLHSYLREDAEAVVSVAAESGLTVDWTEQKVSIPAKSFAGLPITLRARSGGVYPLHATVYLPDGKTPPERLAVFCLPAGGILADRGAKEARIENEWTRLIVKTRAGETTLYASQPDVGLGSFRERVGPPFWPSELDDKEFDISLREDSGRITTVLTADMDSYDGLKLRQEVTMGAGPLIEIAHGLINQGTTPHSLQISSRLGHWHNDGATLTVPLKDGIVQSRRSEFPAAENDIDKRPEAFSERWAAISSKYGTLGLLWTDSVAETEFGWGISLLGPRQEYGPQQETPSGRWYLYVGPGDWRTVRNHARRLAGVDGQPEPIPVEARPTHEVLLEPAPLVTIEDQVTVTLAIDNLRTRPLEGEAQLYLPEGLHADRERFTFSDLCTNTSLAEAIRLDLAPEAAAYEGIVTLRTRLFDQQVSLPLIRLGDRSLVTVRHHASIGLETYTVDNGRMQFTVAPGFTGALIAWVEGEVNHLLSPFPAQKTFGWMSPWYGGITPLAMKPHEDDLPGKLYQETLAAQTVDAPDERGIPWRGVRLHCNVEREPFVGLHIKLDYLTVGQSNALKLVYRVQNTTTAKRRIDIGWFAFVQPDGAPANNTLRSAFVERKATPWETWSEAEHWGMATHPETGRTVMMVSAHPNARLIDWGSAGGHLAWISGIDVPSRGFAERTCYLVLCSDPAQANRYVWLSQYR